MKSPVDCDVCIAKKRKCSREPTKCSQCSSQGIPCNYQKTSTKSALEERLRKLEAIVKNMDLDKGSNPDMDALSPGKAPSVIPASPAPSHASFPSHVDAPRPDLEDLFFSTGSAYLFLSENQVRKAIQESFFLRYVVYTLSATVAQPSMVTAEFGSRQEMAECYFKRAESFLRRVFRKPSYHGVLGLFGLILYCTRTERGPEAFYYYTVGTRIALNLGLNKEKMYTSAGLSEESKEIMRGTFWTVYVGDRMLSALRFEPPMIKEQDVLVKLPSPPGAIYHPQDHMDELQIAIMSSDEWYIPTPRNLSVNAYLLILVKIHGRIIAFSQETKSEKSAVSKADFLFRESALSASLRDWYAAIPDFVKNVINEISAETPPLDPTQTWPAAYLMILYYCIKIYLPKQSLLANIQENVQLASSCSAAREVFLAGCNLADILKGFLKHNPKFLFVPPFVASCIFGASLMILIVSRMNLNPTDIARGEENLAIYKSCLVQHATLYNIGNAQKAILDRMLTCRDPVLLCFAIKNLRNMKGESVTAMSSDVLVANEEEGHLQPPVTVTYPAQTSPVGFANYGDSALLESVAIMANPYSDLMIGAGVGGDYSGIFDFNMGK